jgi:hypothetical protein
VPFLLAKHGLNEWLRDLVPAEVASQASDVGSPGDSVAEVFLLHGLQIF